MRNFFRSRVAAVSIGALVVVGLGAGSATAAKMIDSDGVRNNSLQQVDLGRGSVGKSELKDNAVGPRFLSDGLLARIQSNSAQQGEKGDTGEQGEQGAPGKDGVTGYELHNREARWTNGVGSVTVPCPEGKVALGGGFTVESIRGGDAEVKVSQPVYNAETAQADGWQVTGVATGDANVKAWATCAMVG
jgi:hypothetical protein